jgi:3-methylcrotonyl-CoA carboxylase alpha subunit
VIDSLLVANRGEIACRIFRTARRMGVRTIAVYSEVDAGARHVREADVAVCIGGAAARDSYLNIPRLLEAAVASHAQAVHPGYGFLSEHAQFAAACKEAGLVFVGPPAEAIAAMGSKIVAKARMRAAGVPVLPGYGGEEQDLAHLEEQARRLPLPLIIKPAAGGGGKGMQIITDAAQIAPGLAAARRLADSAFGDGTLLLERFLPAPRHVEVQVFADSRGAAIHLGDRDCSLQRRHQKVIEEAPAPNIPADVRERMRTAALVVAREIGYVGAGTVEFLFDAGEFYFMEMNTRLQVEHTVTEAVTGLDLVEWQLRIAAGEALPLAQSQIAFRGHAMEARVCAEDPQREFLPSSGHLQLLEWPQGESVRVDAGFQTGDEVPSNYDSLLGKVIAWAPTRSQAAARLAAGLDRTYCAGVHTNERWLARILRNERFLAARHSVALLRESSSLRLDPIEPPATALILAALAARGALSEASAGPWDSLDGFTPNLPSTVGFAFLCHQRRYEVELECSQGMPVRGRIAAATASAGASDAAAAAPLELADVSLTAEELNARFGPLLLRARYCIDAAHVHVWLGAEHFDFLLDDPRNREYSSTAARGGLTTPLPGVVVAVSVKPGQKVVAGEVLMVVEAMKMEHTITAPYAGVVQGIHCAPGDRVPEGKALLELTEISERNAAE